MGERMNCLIDGVKNMGLLCRKRNFSFYLILCTKVGLWDYGGKCFLYFLN